ncbi:hypothetical protein Pmani_028321 [Petrolisthes manimaculis]|uniref:HTH CENPB-type domain-containing protein n=1 Tax=Petrolisthes manimaculis TaxID=1843537 RepID=A0AAE1P0C0_9EUCA|nr:hypothetical protein Pmani_028321 [Petrolisthes manimaculis]
MPLSEQLICEKARTIFQDLKKEHGKEDNSSETFVASKGWFNRFKCRGDLKNRRIYGEAASADEEGAKKFLEHEWVSEGRVGGAAPSCVCDNNNNTDCGRMTPLDNILVRGGWCGVEYTRLANITHYVQ